VFPEQDNTNLWCFSYTLLSESTQRRQSLPRERQTRVLAYVYLPKSRRNEDGMCKDIAIKKALFAKEFCAWNENALLASARIPLRDWKKGAIRTLDLVLRSNQITNPKCLIIRYLRKLPSRKRPFQLGKRARPPTYPEVRELCVIRFRMFRCSTRSDIGNQLPIR
jgi:hypothetical protein